MSLHKLLPTLGALAALAALPLCAAPAHAATGGTTTDNPGLVALTTPDGEHRCSAVLVAPDWALWSDTARCGKATEVVDGAGNRASVAERHYFHASKGGLTPNVPTKSQAMLLRLGSPLENAPVARLSAQAPTEGERLAVVGFPGIAGPDGGDAVDIANVHAWGKELTRQG